MVSIVGLAVLPVSNRDRAAESIPTREASSAAGANPLDWACHCEWRRFQFATHPHQRLSAGCHHRMVCRIGHTVQPSYFASPFARFGFVGFGSLVSDSAFFGRPRGLAGGGAGGCAFGEPRSRRIPPNSLQGTPSASHNLNTIAHPGSFTPRSSLARAFTFRPARSASSFCVIPWAIRRRCRFNPNSVDSLAIHAPAD
jgi:hypothetical protein